MNYNYEQLGRKLAKYYEMIKSQIEQNLNLVKGNILETRNGDYEIIKAEATSLDKLSIEGDKIHCLFSQDGCNISGDFILQAIVAHLPISDRNGYPSYCFKVSFDAIVTFDSVNEDFEMSDFNIDHIIIVLDKREIFKYCN